MNECEGADLALLELNETVSPNKGRLPKLIRLQGNPKQLEEIPNVSVFGYVSSQYQNSNTQNDDQPIDNSWMRGHEGSCSQTNVLRGTSGSSLGLKFRDKHGLLILRGEFFVTCTSHSFVFATMTVLF